MIMPNIAAFIAWGIITALFIEAGPFPSPSSADSQVPTAPRTSASSGR